MRRHRLLLWASLLTIALTSLFLSCQPIPPLHLHRDKQVEIGYHLIRIDLNVFWQYRLDYDDDHPYDYREFWTYGWDRTDEQLFGPIGYTEPNTFELRRYHLGETPHVPHTNMDPHLIEGRTYVDEYELGYYDILVWNELHSRDEVLSTVVDEEATLDSVSGWTNMSFNSLPYRSKYNRAFNQPEEIFTAYERDIEITDNLDDYDYYDPETNTYYKNLDMELNPITYIYLIQIRLHHNYRRVVESITGSSNLSGVSRGAVFNSGISFDDPVTVHYDTRLKRDCVIKESGEIVDVIGGRCLTFGITDQNSAKIYRRADVRDKERHYVDANMIFYNGLDSTFVFDVTDSIRKYYKGGVITIDLDLDTVPIPVRAGGNGFDAVVEDFKEELHEFEVTKDK